MMSIHIVKFKMDGQTYVYNLNKYVKTIFKEDVTLLRRQRLQSRELAKKQ